MKKIKLSYLVLVAFFISSCDLLNFTGTNTFSTDEDSTQCETEVVWASNLAVQINPALGRNYMPAIDEDDNIYILMKNWEDNSYTIQKFNKNGELKWTNIDKENIAFRQYISYYNGKLYYPTNNKIICLNASDGKESWSYTPSDSVETTYSLTITNGNVAIFLSGFTANHSYLTLINAQSGSISSMYAMGSRGDICALASNKSTLYATFNKLYSFSTGSDKIELNWEILLPKNSEDYDDTYTNMDNDIAIDPENGNLYFTYENIHSYGEKWLIAYNKNGNKLWESEVYSNHITVDFGSQVYVGSSKLYKLNGNSANPFWETSAPDFTFGFGSFDQVTLGDNGLLFAGDYFGLYGVNSQGETKLKLSNEEAIGVNCPLSFVTLLSNGNIIVMAMADSDDKGSKIYCLKSDTKGIKKKTWSKWGADAGNTFNLNVGS